MFCFVFCLVTVMGIESRAFSLIYMSSPLFISLILRRGFTKLPNFPGQAQIFCSSVKVSHSDGMTGMCNHALHSYSLENGDAFEISCYSGLDIHSPGRIYSVMSGKSQWAQRWKRNEPQRKASENTLIPWSKSSSKFSLCSPEKMHLEASHFIVVPHQCWELTPRPLYRTKSPAPPFFGGGGWPVVYVAQAGFKLPVSQGCPQTHCLRCPSAGITCI